MMYQHIVGWLPAESFRVISPVWRDRMEFGMLMCSRRDCGGCSSLSNAASQSLRIYETKYFEQTVFLFS